jgi:phosphate transport system substrate-binding protein
MRLATKVAAAAVMLVIGAGAAAPVEFVSSELKGTIKADGSSTTYLITEAMADTFKKIHPEVKISVGISGTGGGFKKFAAGETDISNASRAIKPNELADCQKNGIEPIELQVAWDGLAVVIHKDNNWARKMTVAQLKKIWEPDSRVEKWSDVDPSWPNEKINLFGAGTDSGTFDFFTEKINGKEKACRSKYTATEDDTVTVKGVANDRYALGFFGVAYYEQNKDKLGVVAISMDGKTFVEPTVENVLNKSYQPLSRPLFIYVKRSSLQRPEVQEFLRFYLRRNDLVSAAKYIELPPREQSAVQKKLEAEIKKAAAK